MPDSQHKTSSQPQLPDSLRAQLKQFRSHLWRIKIMEAVWAGFFGLLLSYVLVFTLDRFIPTSGLVRLLILIAGVSVFAIFAPLWINRWVFKHRRENQIAQLIAKQYPRLGDRLLGVVELQNQDEHDTSLSSQLRVAAMDQVASEFSDRDLTNALPITWHKKWGLAVLALAAISTAAWVTTPKAGFNALQRWLMPLAEIERYTQTKIDRTQLPTPYYVAQGEPFDLTIHLTEDSNTPGSAKARAGINGWMQSPENTRSYTFNFPKTFKQKILDIQVGDDFQSIEIKPVTRPTLDSLSATIQFPDYLQKESERIDLSSGQTSIVEGATVTITGNVNRPLIAATASVIVQAMDGVEVLDAPPQKLTPSISNNQFTLPSLLIEKNLVTLPLNWTDEHQLKNLIPTNLSIEKELDVAPSAYVENSAEIIYVLADASIQFDIAADDDFGIKQAGFSWDGTFTKPSPHKEAKGSLAAIQGNPRLTQSRESIDFSFQAYDIRPQKLSIRAWAEDYKEGRPRVYSSPITVYVLTKAEHRELMEQRAKKAVNKLEDLMRNEQQLLDENKQLEKLSGKELQTDEQREKLAEQAQKERENAEKMKDIAKSMEEIFEEASKNDKIDSDTLKKLADSALKMKQMAQKQMPEISKKLDDSQSRENTEQKAQDEVKDAVAKQEELLKEMEDTIKKTEEANKQLEIGTFVNRLKKAAQDENLLAQTLIHMMLKQNPKERSSNFITNEFDSLEPSLQRAVIALYSQQQQTTSDVNWIEEDLGHFYLRTQKEEHKVLLEKIRNSTIHRDLESLANQMEGSQNYLATIRAKQIATLLNSWAKELEAAASKDKNGGGGGGGGQGADSEDFEFMLRVMRLIQQETAIRSRIRSLEQKKRFIQPKPQPLSPSRSL